MRARAVVLAVAIVLAPLGARAADLVVWWEKGFYPQEDEAVREIIAAFEQKTGKQVELVFHPTGGASGQGRGGARGRPAARLRCSASGSTPISAQWAYEDRLVDLTDAIGPFSDLFDPDALDAGHAAQRQDRADGPSTRCRWAGSTNHVHVWKSLLERAGFTLDDIPKEWEAFWSFWCDQVQPAVRKALGRDDIWGVGLPMSAEAGRHRRSSSSSSSLPTTRTT